MLPYRDSRLTKIFLILFFIVVIGYAYYEARGILFGPSISIPEGLTEVHQPFITIEGKADRISSIAMNGKSISVTQQGDFSEPYLLSPGYNRILLEAKDTYGRVRRKVIEIVYTPNPNAPASAPAARAAPDMTTASTSATSTVRAVPRSTKTRPAVASTTPNSTTTGSSTPHTATSTPAR